MWWVRLAKGVEYFGNHHFPHNSKPPRHHPTLFMSLRQVLDSDRDLLESANNVESQLRALAVAAVGCEWFTADHAKALEGKARELGVAASNLKCTGRCLDSFLFRDVPDEEAEVEDEEEDLTASEAEEDEEAEAGAKADMGLFLESRYYRVRGVVVACLASAVGVAKHATGMWVNGSFLPWVHVADVTSQCLAPARLDDEVALLQALVSKEFQVGEQLGGLLTEAVPRTFAPSETVTVFGLDHGVTGLQTWLVCVGLLRVVVRAGDRDLVVTSHVDPPTSVWWTARVPVELALLSLHVTVLFGEGTTLVPDSCQRPVLLEEDDADSALQRVAGLAWHQWPVRFEVNGTMYAADPVTKTVRVLYEGEVGELEEYKDALLLPVSEGRKADTGTLTMVCLRHDGRPEFMLRWGVTAGERPAAAWYGYSRPPTWEFANVSWTTVVDA